MSFLQALHQTNPEALETITSKCLFSFKLLSGSQDCALTHRDILPRTWLDMDDIFN